MRKLFVALARLPDNNIVSHFSGRVETAGFDAVFIDPRNPLKSELEHCASDQECVLLVADERVTDALLASLRSNKIKAIIAVNPVWNHDLAPVLSSVDSKVIIVTDGPELSGFRMQAMKYHDRISGSIVQYLRSDAVKTLLEHPDRVIKMLEDDLNA